MSLKQWEAQEARRERKREQQRAKDEARRERDKSRYDEERSTARLRLIELQSSLDHGLTELAGFRDGTKFPAMDPKRRSSEDRGTGVRRLSGSERRSTASRRSSAIPRTSLMSTAGCRVTGVSGTGGRTGWTVSARSATSSGGCQNWKPLSRPPAIAAERRDHRAKLAEATRDLDRLIAEGPFTADGHVLGVCDPDGASRVGLASRPSPVPRGPAGPPGCAKRDRCSRRSRRTETRGELPPAEPKPQPLAIVPSGLPIADVVAKLTELQQQFPGAEVRRGRANRWELWNRMPRLVARDAATQ